MMFVLTLTITDPEDAGYFTNKTLNKLHGYMRHHSVKLALFFTLDAINIYAADKVLLDDLLLNEAVCFDVKRHIFKAMISPVETDSILVLKRVHNKIDSVAKKVDKQLTYYYKSDENNESKFPSTEEIVKDKKKELVTYYKEQQQKQREQQHNYFVIKNKDKTFTIWVKVNRLYIADFATTTFNSYGLLSSVAEKKQALS